MLVPWYLITAYAYYMLDESLIEDAEFDAMSKKLLKYYDTIEHRHKHLVTKENLAAGTLLLSEEEYPTIVKEVAIQLCKQKQ
jgi:NAD-dependent DNA ligase